MTISDTDRALAFVRATGAIRPRNLTAAGISPRLLSRLMERGLVERLGRGLYRANPAQITENHGLVLAAQVVPGGVVCLLTALRFHDLTTQLPHEVWMAVDRHATTPRVGFPRLRILRFSGAAFSEGIEEHLIEGVTVKVYSAAKTVVDCFKYRNKIGIDVAVEALRDCLARRDRDIDELMCLAAACRMARVMRPYLESLL